MPLLYLSFKHDSNNRNDNVFSFVLPNEIPMQNVQLKDCTVVLSGDVLEYGSETIPAATEDPPAPQRPTNATVINLPRTQFKGFHGTRLWLQFRNGDILNPRQILSDSSTEAGKIPLPMDYFQGRKKYQYNYIEQGFHIHGVDRGFEVAVFLDDGATPATFSNVATSVDDICVIDLVLEYDEVH